MVVEKFNNDGIVNELFFKLIGWGSVADHNNSIASLGLAMDDTLSREHSAVANYV